MISSRTGAILNKAELIASIRDDRRTIDSMELLELTVRVDGSTAIDV